MSAIRRSVSLWQSIRRGTTSFPPELGRQRLLRVGNRGFVLISSYLLLSLFLTYSSLLSVRTLSQRMAAEQFRDGLQALDLAQAASQQLQQRFDEFLTAEVYATYTNNAISALQWVDSFGKVLSGDESKEQDDLTFDLSNPKDGIRDATSSSNALPVLGLPTVHTATDATAWIVSITNPGGGILDPRHVTIEAVGRVGTVTKRIRTTYQVGLGMSDIFRYAYFLNNYGWMEAPAAAEIFIYGEVRSNGDLRFSGTGIGVEGDLYASENSAVHDPTDPYSTTSEGLIIGDPSEWLGLTYWSAKRSGTPYPQWLGARPNKRLVLDGQPLIAGDPGILPDGYGYDSDYPTPADPDQKRFDKRPIHPMPYLGALNAYKQLAKKFKNPAGGDGISGTADDASNHQGSTLVYYDGATLRKIDEKYESNEPLVLVGTSANPIEIHGPVVAKGDIIIKGYVTGQGTIYAGRNVHIVGDVIYKDPPQWPTLERDTATGQIRNARTGSPLGWLCGPENAFQTTPCS